MSEFIYQFFLSVGLLSIISLLGGIFSARLRQPAVMGLIFVGVLVGPNVLGIVSDNQIMDLLAELGATLLLFSIGVEFSIPKVLSQGLRALAASTIIMGALFIAGYEASVFMGLDFLAALAIGASFSFSSTAIFIRLMQSHGLLNAPQIPFLISVLVFEDIVAVFAMAFFSGIGPGVANGELAPIAISLLSSIAIMGFAYFALSRITTRLFAIFSHSLSDEHIMLLSLGLALTMAFFSTAIGLSAAVGAFIAGSILANLPIKKRIQAIISPLILAFSSYFFISIGLFVSPVQLFASLPLIIILCALFIVVSFIATSVSAYLMGFRGSDAVVAGASMVVMGEFSLLVAQQIAPQIKGFDLLSTVAAIVFATTFFSSILLAKRRMLSLVLSRLMPRPAIAAGSGLRGYISSVISKIESNSASTMKAKASLISIAQYGTISTVIISSAIFVRSYMLSHLGNGIFSQILAVLPLISLIAIIPLAFKIIIELKKLADALTSIFMPEGIRRANGTVAKAAAYTALIVLFLALFISIPAAVQMMQLPKILGMLNIIPLLAMLLVLYNGLSHLASRVPSRMIKSPRFK
ncbi:MAG: cation:proton antiporter [Candidatus Micrarchaeota archaeon]